MKEKRRCSILFHLLVPGGRWLTTMSRPNSLASFCNSRFHSRTREPLLPPPSAVISNRVASGYRARPTVRHHWRMLLTANAAVSWSTPTHPTRIGGEVVDPVRHRAAELLDQEVMDANRFRIALRTILAARIAEIPDQLVLLGVDRDHRLLFGQSRGHLGVDMGELGIPVGMAVALL